MATILLDSAISIGIALAGVVFFLPPVYQACYWLYRLVKFVLAFC